jgi:hypothetical protein
MGNRNSLTSSKNSPKADMDKKDFVTLLKELKSNLQKLKKKCQSAPGKL